MGSCVHVHRSAFVLRMPGVSLYMPDMTSAADPISTSPPPYFSVRDGYAVYRPLGSVTLKEVIALVTSAIAYARAQGIQKLMVVTTGLTGFKSPSLAERYFFLQDWVRAGGGGVRLAMVISPEMIDPGKFGVTAATNAGIINDVFACEDQALAWLQAERGD